ncbi:MAG: transketolase [Verrucomicrobiota bacterium]|nr:transketolase [Verrucomicrobiota bacterium]
MKTVSNDDLQLTANTIRGLAMDGVQKANSGHPGMPMGMADLAAALFLQHLEYSPGNPLWPNRDRFVLSAGHGAMLLYSLLHLAGYDLPLAELAQFRQLGSKTPGHPEYGLTPGVETSTGPLGQGCGNAVGMALAERMLAGRFDTADFSPVEHTTYVLASDGDMMEGLSHEAFSLAGHLGLNKLIVFYDYNLITIEGKTDLAYGDDVRKRFLGYRWNVLESDAHNFDAIRKAIRRARREKERPTLVICHSHIGKGSPNKADTAQCHGAPLGADEVKAAKKNLGLPEDKDFYVPDKVYALFAERRKQLERKAAGWQKDLDKYFAAYPDKAALWKQHMEDVLPDNLAASPPEFPIDKPLSTRVASGKTIQALAKALPQFVGGSADLAPSTMTLIENALSVGPRSYSGRNFHFGIREHAMCAMLNGIMLHGGFRAFGATFFVFFDYCRPAVRLAALMKLPVIYVFTHDSFYVGEDGPTHEPVEQIAALRCIPGVTVIRPADPTETAAAWLAALRNKGGPTALLLTRHNLPVIDRRQYPPAGNLEHGAYTLWQSGQGMPDVLLIASGSEVELALKAAKELAAEHNVRVVSMPSWELFEKQLRAYRDEVLPPACKTRLAIEAGVSMGWEKYVGEKGRVLGLNRFGASAPYKVLAEKFGFTVPHVVKMVRELRVGLVGVTGQ